MVLGAHDPPGLMVVDGDAVWLQRLIGRVLWCVGQRVDRSGGLGQRHGCFVAVVHLAAVLAAAQPALELADSRLERGVEAVRARFAADDGAATPRGDLYVLTVLSLAPVALMVEFDVEEVDGAVKSFQAGQFLGDVNAEVIGNLDVAALDDDLGVEGGFGRLLLDQHGAGCVHGLVGRAWRLFSLCRPHSWGAGLLFRPPPGGLHVPPAAGARCRLLTSYRWSA